MQARFLAAFASAIAQDLAIAENEHVRDELFVTSVLLGLGSVKIEDMCRGGYDGEVSLNFEAQALKHAQLFEQFALETKDSFFFRHS